MKTDSTILNIVLDVTINMSAFVSAFKTKNRIVNIIIRTIYCFIITALPVTFIAMLLYAISKKEGVNFDYVVISVEFITMFLCFYYIIATRNRDKQIEEYMLEIALYLEEFINDTKEAKIRKKIIIRELGKFLFIFVVLTIGVVYLLISLKTTNVNLYIIAAFMSIITSYILFAYITKDNAIRNRRKRLIKVVVSIFWLVIVFIRLGQYLRDMTQLELVDMLLLMFSIVFTFPTIHDWVRSIPEKIIRPYEAIVYERKKNVQTMYNELNEKFSSRFNKFRKDMGDTPNSKKNIIRVVVKIVAFVVLFVVITILMAKSIKQEDWAINKIVNWHDNLESDRKLLVNKIYACVVMVGLMVIVILRGVKIYSFKTSRFEKIKFVIELIILEFVMGCGLAMILSQ